MEFPSQAVRFSPEAFDEAISAHGVQYIHYRALRCPVGLVDINDIRRPHDHHENCSNGFIYTKVGTLTCLFVGNDKNAQYQDTGRVDGSSVTVCIPRKYDDCDQAVQISYADRMYLKADKILVVGQETFLTKPSGIDRLTFPAESVTDLIDSRGVRYNQGDEFCIKDGKIVWSNGPGIDPETGRGVVCSVRYMYAPFFYIKNLIHEVRVARTEDESGDSLIQLMPQLAVLQREIVFQNEQNDEEAARSKPDRQQDAPIDAPLFGDR
jgi:hypothetical protein